MRHFVITSLAVVLLLLGGGSLARQRSAQEDNSANSSAAPRINLVDVADKARLNAFVVCGNDQQKNYIIETTGCGVAFLDYDNDGWLDVFVVNGSRLEAFPEGKEPTNYLFHNQRDGTFRDVTRSAGLVHSGWGQAVCAGDYDNDGWVDLLVTYYGHNVLYHNQGNGTFVDATKAAGLWDQKVRWSSGCSFVDYDRDGRLDLFVANYVDFDMATTPAPGANVDCQWRGVPVMCGPRGLKSGVNHLYRNEGNGTFRDVSESAGVLATQGQYALSVLTFDSDNDGWPDIYVACDSAPSILYRNNRDGTFTDVGMYSGSALNEDGKEQAGMGASAGDFNNDGWFDIIKTNFSDDTPSLYRNNGDGTFADYTYEGGLGVNTRYLGWGTGFVDLDHDGWQDIFIVNGHVYPQVGAPTLGTTYRERPLLYWNRRNSTFADISQAAGPAMLAKKSSRGLAFGDFDNDGSLELLINNMEDRPSLLKNIGPKKNWLTVKTVGTKSNRSGIGARISITAGGHRQTNEVRSGGSYYSQSDLRVHFGVGEAQKIDLLEVAWPSGLMEKTRDLPVNRHITIIEGKGVVQSNSRK